MPKTIALRAVAQVVTAATLAACMAGCTAEVETRPVVASYDESVVEAQTVPAANIDGYPHTEYGGRVVYFVNGRWYYPQGRRWYYYRNEPPELVRHRPYVQQAPPARREYQPRPGEYQPRPGEYQPRPGEAVRVQ